MALCLKLLFGPAAAIFLSAVVIVSCFTNLPYLRISYSDLPSLSHSYYFAPAPVSKCDIFRGEWVPDPDSPQYTNETCSYIQDHQNCMYYGRPDLEFLMWRWKPDGCDLPRFDPHKFLQVVGNKTLAFVGDSLARNHMQSLLCLLSKVATPRDLAGTGKHHPDKILYYDGYNFTIYILWSPFLVRAEEVADSPGAYRLYLDEPEEKWLSVASRFDYVLLSAANWFTRQSYFYERGQLIGGMYVQLNFTSSLTNRYSHRMAFRTALRALSGVRFRGKVIVRTLSPMSHFEGGPYNAGGDCRRTRPYRANETTPMEGVELDFYTSQLEEFREAAAVRGLDMVLMDPTAAMLMRPDGHPSRYGHWPDEKRVLYNDCIHWCLPGPVDAWNDMLLHMLSE
ncbi:protein trichome birefringence-like 20 [Phragmites australis]|uniref:protein trichome birefringence-like 20 n=1 Tax=Phragmites australis TaxID=29695 RepID=UPI002D77F64B|nr:protein trichome birefringence-like 20 [Phragmites australis]